MSAVIIVLVLLGLYLLMIKPNSTRKNEFKPYESVYIAHRGLFNNKDVSENSLEAFKRAVEHNYGIELDIQLTTDDKLVVYHDDTLKRISGIDKKIYECSYEELKGYHLLNDHEKIPLFKEVMDIIKEDTPLIIEIKPDGRYIETVKKTVEFLKDYKGIYCMESFNPLVVKWLKDNHPQIIRGQLAYNYFKGNSKQSFVGKLVFTNLLMNFLTKPDFIAYDHRHANSFTYKLIRRIYQVENVAWTIKSKEDLITARKNGYNVMIFDSFIPEEKSSS